MSRWPVHIAAPGVIGVLLVIAVALHLPYVNGHIWVWLWRDPPAYGVYLTSLPVLPLLLWLLARIDERRQARVGLTLAGLVLVCFLFQVLALYGEEFTLARLVRFVWSPLGTSYFTDAALIDDPGNWLRNFHLVDKHAHSNTHPPGAILTYYALIQLMGPIPAALAGGLLTGAVASTGVLLAYRLARYWGGGQRACLLAAANYAVLPALILVLPQFDQIYPLFAMVMILCWAEALERGYLRDAILFGAVLSVAVFFAYNLLTLGSFLALFTCYRISCSADRGRALVMAARQAGTALGVVVSAYGVLFVLTGYDPVAAFLDALAWQAEHEHRPYAPALLINLYDFALGGGMLIAVIFARHLWRAAVRKEESAHTLSLSIISVATIVIINLTGLLDYETVRVWLFLQPLILVPASLELARYPMPAIVGYFVLNWTIVTTLKANMYFNGP